MRIEIRQSGGEPCPECGATPLVHAPALNRHLEQDVHAAIDGLNVGWWRPMKRRHHRKSKELFAEVAQRLREDTIYA